MDELELSVRSHNCLRAANIKTIADLVRREEAELLKFRNFGRKSLAELSEIIEAEGLTFGMDVEQVPERRGVIAHVIVLGRRIMRHRKSGRKLKRTASHRRALLANLCTSLLRHKRIITTVAKAKETRMVVEKMITRAKHAGVGRGPPPPPAVHARREVGETGQGPDGDQGAVHHDHREGRHPSRGVYAHRQPGPAPR